MTPRRYLFCLLVLLPAGSLFGQEDTKVPVIPFDGPEVFCYLLKSRNFAAVKEITELGTLPASETVVIVFGEHDPIDRLRRAIGGLRKFHDKGGAVLFASDRPGVLSDWGVQI